MSRYALDDAHTSWKRSGFPLTIGVVVIKFLVLVAISVDFPVWQWMVCLLPAHLSQPWRLLTYPLVSGDVWNWIFMAGAMYFFGGSLERSWGTRTFALFFVALSLINAALLALSTLPESSFEVGASDLQVIGAVVVAWGVLNAWEIVYVWFIPFQGRWLAALVAFIVFFESGGTLFQRLCALGACGTAFFWVRNRNWGDITHWTPRRPARQRAAKPRRPRDDAFSWRDLNPFERIARARRKKKFERLFEDDK